MLQLGPNEEAFEVRPIGIRYKCEFCQDGEQIVDPKGAVLTSMPPLFPHKCNKCGKTMHLPKTYPYIYWENLNDSSEDKSDEEKKELPKKTYSTLVIPKGNINLREDHGLIKGGRMD